jgi:subtilisin family serine protease
LAQANGNIWVNSGEVPGNGVDDDANGRIDDTIGFDFVSSSSAAGCKCLDVDCSVADNNPNDGDGHGTHVAGTVAAITNNARAVAGVAGGFSDGIPGGAGNGSKVMALRIG